jgi:ABC-type nitrate/sulfonate/bicarbonate transport system substrate-binding protein
MKRLRIALDWTPNTNHTGFYVAQGFGWYSAAGLDVELAPPSSEYSVEETPARQVIEGRADLCVAPSESVLSSWTTDKDRPRLVAVAALLQKHASAVAVLKSSGITSLRELDEKVYASYGGRFEMNIIREVVRRDGGKGDVIETNPPKLDCFDVVMRGEADATWIFEPWEGVKAAMSGVKLNTFPIADDASGFSYGYSPVLLAHPKLLEGEEALTLRSFLAATERGYQYAAAHPVEAVGHLLNVSQHPSLLQESKEFLIRSQQFLSENGYYLNASDGSWGRMDSDRWRRFVEWLLDNGLLSDRSGTVVTRDDLDYRLVFTNDCL